ncbi:MAG: glutamine amidotransferase family protein [Bacillota bacterium]|jgi:glutamate synthase domain-containing protein 1|nr:glutamine amidotransferase family protein [Bacillota bacterium]
MKNFPRIPSGCSIVGIFNKQAKRFSGADILRAIRVMHDRSNGLGGGFAGYGIYPEYKDCYTFHLMYEGEASQHETEHFLEKHFIIERSEPIPTRPHPRISDVPILWRYFLRVKPRRVESFRGREGTASASSPQFCQVLEETTGEHCDERDFVVEQVILINRCINGAFVASSGKNMGVFKGVGYPEDIGEFYRIEEYEGYLWTGHGRFPTNTPGWWGGAHPFTILDWSVVHNGEISSYGINKRYLEMFGYHCTLQTDTEVIAYLFDLLHRRHGLPLQVACLALAPPFWKDLDGNAGAKGELAGALRQVYGSALLNGPFSIVVGYTGGVIGLTDRIKLRPLVCGERDNFLYLASEECAIREVCPAPDRVWAVKAGEPVIGQLEEGVQP